MPKMLLKAAMKQQKHYSEFRKAESKIGALLEYGFIAGLYGIKKLGITNTGMEEIIAIIETNNCFADGVQMVTGYSFGSNALVYRDYGKTAVTISKRDGQAIRLVLNPRFEDSREKEYPEAYEMFNKLITRREQGSSEDYARLMASFAEISAKELYVPAEEMFWIKREKTEIPSFAPIFESVKCAKCDENVMISKVIKRNGEYYCIRCLNEEFFELNGSGIARLKK